METLLNLLSSQGGIELTIIFVGLVVWKLVKEFIKHKHESNEWKTNHDKALQDLTNSIDKLNDKIESQHELFDEKLNSKIDK